MAPINTTELSALLRSRLAQQAANLNPDAERERLVYYSKIVDKFLANPSMFSDLDGQPPEIPDHARQVKKAKFEQSPLRVNKENSAPNPRMIPPARFMSPIAEDGVDVSNPSLSQPGMAECPPSAHKTDKLVQAMNVVKLRKELKKRGKDTVGRKRELQARLAQAIREQRREDAVKFQQAAAPIQKHQEDITAMNSTPAEVIESKIRSSEPTDQKSSSQTNMDECHDVTMEVSKLSTDDPVDDVPMVDAAAVSTEVERNTASEKKQHESFALKSASKIPSSAIASEEMVVEPTESIVALAREKSSIPSNTSPDSGLNVEGEHDKLSIPTISPKKFSSGNVTETMDVEPDDRSNGEIAKHTSFSQICSSQIVSASKVLELEAMTVDQAMVRSESAPPQMKKAFVSDHLPTSPFASKPQEDEKSKQVLLSLKKLREKPAPKAIGTECKQENAAISSAYKVPSLAALRSEQKASLKVNNGNSGESFLANSIKLAPLGLSTISKVGTDDARKARLAEMRCKSKPVALTKPIETTSQIAKAFASLKKVAATVDFTDQKKKLLAAQMREKTAAVAAASAAAQKKDNAEPLPKAAIETASKEGELSTSFVPQQSSQSNVTESVDHSAVPAVCSAKKVPAAVAAWTKKATPATAGSAQKAAPAQNGHRREDIFSPMSTYEISDRENSDSDDEDSDEEDSDMPNKKIPKWARKEFLEPALVKQFQDNRLDPDEIFSHEISTCDLEAIFEKKKSKFRKRTSSGNWAKDRVTPAEQLAYRRAMGYNKKK